MNSVVDLLQSEAPAHLPLALLKFPCWPKEFVEERSYKLVLHHPVRFISRPIGHYVGKSLVGYETGDTLEAMISCRRLCEDYRYIYGA